MANKKLDELIQTHVARWLRQTLRLVRCDPSTGLPQAVCSGFLVTRGARHVLVSAGHGLGKGAWFLETGMVVPNARESILVPLRGVWQLEEIKSGEPMGSPNIDLAWVDVDVEKLRDELKNEPRLKGLSWDLPTYVGPLDGVPSKSAGYGFAAWNRVEIHKHDDDAVLVREHSFEFDMAYEGDELDSQHYRFKLARKHQGHRYYRGSSGAPIADGTGQYVSLVVGGDEATNIIWGLPLVRYREVMGL
ncbi:MAG: hypothetical protein JNK05_11610 [Myxococcales bacterium]|nr:hypothetical protein [Myxococcales bacterium]